jgi:hypothetical protein
MIGGAVGQRVPLRLCTFAVLTKSLGFAMFGAYCEGFRCKVF